MKRHSPIVVVLTGLALALAVWLVWVGRRPEAEVQSGVRPQDGAERAEERAAVRPTGPSVGKDRPRPPAAVGAETDGTAVGEEAPAGSPDGEDCRDDDDGSVEVEAFDALTDKWMESSGTDVTLQDVDAFVKAFRRIPKDRRDECVHRALNLIPDENVMLLAGILMDRSMDRETVEAVFNDILNRDESVKKPIMMQVFRDRSHPCWADTAWILDVTGEAPSEK